MKRLIEKEDVERAVKGLVEAGRKVTNNGIYAALGKRGSLTTIVKHLKRLEKEKQEKELNAHEARFGQKGMEEIEGGRTIEERIQEAVDRQMKEKVGGLVRESFMELVEDNLGVMVQQMVLQSAGVIESGMRVKFEALLAEQREQREQRENRSVSPILIEETETTNSERSGNFKVGNSRETFEVEIREEVGVLRLEVVELMEVINQVLAEGAVLMGYMASQRREF